MLRLLASFVLVPCILFANTYSGIKYQITPQVHQEFPVLQIEATYLGEFKDQVTLDLPDKWAGVSYSEQIKNVKIKDPSAQLIKKGHQVLITTPPAQNLTITYEVHRKKNDPSDVHETIVRHDIIHSTGYGMLTIPADISDEVSLPIQLTWIGLPKAWKTISSFGRDQLLKFTTKLRDLSHALYVAGDIRIFESNDKDTPYFLSLNGTYKLKDEELAQLLSKIIVSQRNFFKDHNFPYYAVSLIQSDNPHTLGGTGLTNAFTGYIPHTISKKDYILLLAHEHLHSWMNGKIQNDNGQSDATNYWWSEGFTDYYARVTAYRAGLISIEEFVDECNRLLRNYYFSPVINTPNARIVKDFWTNTEIEKLAYARGFVFALYVNALIKKTNPAHSLDNVMRDLLKTAQTEPFSVTHFAETAKTYIPVGIEEEIVKFITQGATLDVSLLSGQLPIEKIQIGKYERGFEGDDIVRNIIHDSNAYRAGLRSGNKIISMDFPKFSDPDQLVTIKTDQKTLTYRPESDQKFETYQVKKIMTNEDKELVTKFIS